MTEAPIEIRSPSSRDEALALIDGKLEELCMRSLVPQAEFTDLLLDLRILLATESQDVPA